MRRELVTGCTSGGCDQFETSPEATVFYAESRHAVLRTGDCALGRALVS